MEHGPIKLSTWSVNNMKPVSWNMEVTEDYKNMKGDENSGQ